ncbi:hypothetical protein PAXINDRAFT_19023 [Paxillus involutus ATCC 200175]|uniref:Uncharacterized protein n=1 Tax=Paxillus involutus ATCC 200175 TaxID=664439 RepID=A0A0C9TIL5_PAXIN|nr:hypothetical protein PAXINDRAFT_19023 [Paxillus involutus ATCC 200175]
MMILFIDYLVDVSEGKFTDKITVRTLVNNVAIFLGTYQQLPNQRISKEDSTALFNYAKGDDIHRTVFVYGHDTLVPTYTLVHQSRASLQAETPGAYSYIPYAYAPEQTVT